MTGSALALPLLAAGSASAADAATWDRVAACESGGQWSANLGNGAFGGLQMTQEAWERHGGLDYAPSPDLASRAQQIAVADTALAAGSTDWDTCAPIAGLENDGRPTGVQPGPAVPQEDEGGVAPESNRTGGAAVSTPTAETEEAQEVEGTTETTPGAVEKKGAGATAPASPATPATPTTPATQAPEGTATPPASATPDAPADTAPTTPTTPTAPDASTGTPDAPVTTPGAPETPLAPTTPVTPGAEETADAPSATEGTGKHRGEAAPEESDVTDTTQESGRHAAAADKVTSTPVNSDASDAYTVRPGDSLSEIAQENDLVGGWDALYDANRQTVGADPDLILPGQSLELKAASKGK
ncbi:transglycosylase family protein [Streptomyces sp. R301]|uniref:LysM peptidoglycan-binding domain-containing protein n=1 Tax=unclassified Streptomyces TaxID=2593676 RepID=UPI003211F88C